MPSVCLSVDDLQMAHCCMPSALSHSGQNQSPSIGTEWGKKIWKVHLSCTEQNGPCCQGSQFMSRRKAEKKGCVKAHCTFFFSLPLFFFYCEVYLSAAPLQGSQSSLTTEDMFSLCEIQSLWYAGKLLFSTPNCCLWEASVKNSFSFQSEFDKSSKMKSACSYFPITRLRMRIRNLLVWFEKSAFFFFLSLLWSATVQNVCNSRHKKADGFLSWIGLLLNYIGTLSCEVYSLITILLKNTGVILGSYKMEDRVENTFVS